MKHIKKLNESKSSEEGMRVAEFLSSEIGINFTEKDYQPKGFFKAKAKGVNVPGHTASYKLRHTGDSVWKLSLVLLKNKEIKDMFHTPDAVSLAPGGGEHRQNAVDFGEEVIILYVHADKI